MDELPRNAEPVVFCLNFHTRLTPVGHQNRYPACLRRVSDRVPEQVEHGMVQSQFIGNDLYGDA